MADFKKQGGILTGREERWDSFEGEPCSVGGNIGSLNFDPVAAASIGYVPPYNQTAPTDVKVDNTARNNQRSIHKDSQA